MQQVSLPRHPCGHSCNQSKYDPSVSRSRLWSETVHDDPQCCPRPKALNHDLLWQVPPTGKLRVNVEIATHANGCVIALVTRDPSCSDCNLRAEHKPIYVPYATETRAILCALETLPLISCNQLCVIVESDALAVVNQLDAHASHWEADPYILAEMSLPNAFLQQ